MEKTRLIIFAREPRAGQVKTRLLKNLSPVKVASLYKAFLKDVLKTARATPCREKFIYYTGARSPIFLNSFKKDFQFQRQMGKGLGNRMYRAFVKSGEAGFDRTVVIGADTPQLSSRSVKDAFKKLTDHDIVLGPSRDGGYYLIGLRRPDLFLFSGIRWGTDEVLKATLAKASRLKMKIYLLPTLYDIDTMHDLKKFRKDPGICRRAPNSWKAANKII